MTNYTHICLFILCACGCMSTCICAHGYHLDSVYSPSNNTAGKWNVRNISFRFYIPIKTTAKFNNSRSAFFVFLLFLLINLSKHVGCIFHLSTFMVVSQLSLIGNIKAKTVKYWSFAMKLIIFHVILDLMGSICLLVSSLLNSWNRIYCFCGIIFIM